MRVLTLFTVILLPLTLIAEIYGMNGLDLNNLEELPTGFLIVVVSMAAIGIGFLVFFIKKQWLFVRENGKNRQAHHIGGTEHKNHSNNKGQVSYHVFKNK